MKRTQSQDRHTGWPTRPLGDVVETEISTWNTGSHPDEEKQYIEIASIDAASKTIARTHLVQGRTAPSRARTIVHAGDVLVATTRPNLNAVAIVPQELDGQVCSTGFAVLRPTESMTSKWLYWSVRSPAFVRTVSDLVVGAMYPAVTDKQVRSVVIPVPPVLNQQRIVAKLDEQMAALDSAEKALAEQQAAGLAFKRAALQNTLDPVAHSDWPVVTVGQLYQSIPIGGTPPRGVAAYFDGSFPWVSIADMNNTNLITDTREHLSESGIKNSNVKLVRAGSLLFSFKLTVGKVAFAGVDLYTNEAIAAFEPIPRANLQYLRYALPFAADLTTDSNTFGARMLNKEKISSLSIPLPGTAEQRRVTDILDDISLYSDRVFESVASRLELLRRLRSRLLNAAFSGEV